MIKSKMIDNLFGIIYGFLLTVYYFKFKNKKLQDKSRMLQILPELKQHFELFLTGQASSIL